MKARFVFFCICFVLILFAALIIENRPLWGVASIAAAAISEHTAEHLPRSPG